MSSGTGAARLVWRELLSAADAARDAAEPGSLLMNELPLVDFSPFAGLESPKAQQAATVVAAPARRGVDVESGRGSRGGVSEPGAGRSVPARAEEVRAEAGTMSAAPVRVPAFSFKRGGKTATEGGVAIQEVSKLGDDAGRPSARRDAVASTVRASAATLRASDDEARSVMTPASVGSAGQVAAALETAVAHLWSAPRAVEPAAGVATESAPEESPESILTVIETTSTRLLRERVKTPEHMVEASRERAVTEERVREIARETVAAESAEAIARKNAVEDPLLAKEETSAAGAADPDELAWLVNQALVEQARRNGVDLS